MNFKQYIRSIYSIDDCFKCCFIGFIHSCKYCVTKDGEFHWTPEV